MFTFALVQQVTNGRVVALRNEKPEVAMKAIRPDVMQAWFFHEDVNGKYPAQVHWVYWANTGVQLFGPDISEVPSHILEMVRPPILVDMQEPPTYDS